MNSTMTKSQTTKPTIAELEAMLAKGPEGLRVQINPDGSVRVIDLPIISTVDILDEGDPTETTDPDE